jgi:hypothetical protein
MTDAGARIRKGEAGMSNGQGDHVVTRWATALGRAAILFLAIAAAMLASAQTGTAADCDALRKDAQRLQDEYDKLAKYKLPDEQAADLQSALAAIRTLLADTSKDAATRAKQIDDYAEKLKKLHPDNPKLAQFVKKIAEVGGKIGKGLADAGKKMEDFTKALDKADDVLTQFQNSFAISETGTAADQLRDFQAKFDEIRNLPAVNDIPGMKEMFDLYSQAIGNIAESAARIEAEVKRRNELLKEADPDSKGSLYLRLKSQRERLADQRAELGRQLADAKAALDKAGCNPPVAETLTRAQVADKICAGKCDGQRYDSGSRARVAQDLEDQASASASAAKDARAARERLDQNISDNKAKLAAAQAELDAYYAHYANASPPIPKEQLRTENVRDKERLIQKLQDQIRQDQGTVDRLAASAANMSRVAAQDRQRAAGARAEADTAATAYRQCRRDCYQNAVKAGDMPSLPGDLADPSPATGSGGDCTSGGSFVGALDKLNCQIPR